MNIYRLSQDISIQNQEDLANTVRILTGLKNHREKVIQYWKNVKDTSEIPYEEICLKEQEMLKICDEAEKVLRDEISCYKSIRDRKAIKPNDKMVR